MSTALRIAHGRFGRVALLDMDRSLVRHAHPHCHVLIKVDGEDTQFAVGDSLVPLTDRQAVLVNAWEPHAYVHHPEGPRTVILALYIEPGWLADDSRCPDVGSPAVRTSPSSLRACLGLLVCPTVGLHVGLLRLGGRGLTP